MKKGTTILSLFALIVILTLTHPTNTAHAQESLAANIHCIAEAVKLDELSVKQTKVQCFSTQQEAHETITALYEGDDNSFSTTLGPNIAGVFFEHTYRAGRSYTIHSASCDGIGIFAHVLDAANLNNKISSFSNGCPVVILYDGSQWSGIAQIYPLSSTNYVGHTMNDKTSSIKFLLRSP